MTEWVMEHPWMTFFIAMTILVLISNTVANICKVIQTKITIREAIDKQERLEDKVPITINMNTKTKEGEHS